MVVQKAHHGNRQLALPRSPAWRNLIPILRAVTNRVPGTLQLGGAPFHTTHWTVVLQASQANEDQSTREALALFSEAYWPPLYTFVRRRGCSPADAQDVVQGFFAHLFEQNTLSRADREKGRLRTFLLTALQNFLANEYKRARRLKRGGGQNFVSFDENNTQLEAAMAATSEPDDSAYDVLWATNIVEHAWRNLEKSLAAQGDAESLEVLRPFIAGGDGSPPNQEEIASRLKVPIATLRTWISRLRQRYRQCLRVEVASTVSDPADVDEELHYLYEILLR